VNPMAEAPSTTNQQETPAAAGCLPALAVSPVEQIKIDALRATIVEVLHTCYDPEIPVDIYELGLIYDVAITPQGLVGITMTLTSPMCPAAVTLPADVESKVRSVDGVSDVKVDVVWEPTWTPERMSEAARLRLNMY